MQFKFGKLCDINHFEVNLNYVTDPFVHHCYSLFRTPARGGLDHREKYQ